MLEGTEVMSELDNLVRLGTTKQISEHRATLEKKLQVE